MRIRAHRLGTFSLALVMTVFSAGAGLACSQQSDCSGGQVCCFVNLGDFDVSDGQTFSSQETEGSCMSRDACKQLQGNNVVYGPGAECPDGQSVMTCTLSNGSSVTGCYTSCP